MNRSEAQQARYPSDFAARAQELIDAGRMLYGRGWVPATSGNFSARLADGRIVITVSERNKGVLTPDDLMVIGADGRAGEPGKRASAETLLHTSLYRRFPGVGAVLHTHSLNATLLSRLAGGDLHLEGYELLKAFAGIETHESRLVVPIFPNDQDVRRLAAQVEGYLEGGAPTFGCLISGHGLYAWGATVGEALRHLEAFEFLFQCELHMLRISES